MVSEAGHYHNFIELAKEYGDEDYVMERWRKFLKIEAEILDKIELRGDRMH